ncbi:hypothetical protein ACFQ67_13715 [Streptomyces sp. NPDC056488]|uniref:hypothetical protein n=1 Tax=unclassified Streptomyces TaxID=2593676 RepID=UPI0036884CE9
MPRPGPDLSNGSGPTPGSRHGARRLPGEWARRRLAAALLGTGALAATLLTAAVTPAAPPPPDRGPGAASSDVAQLSRD